MQQIRIETTINTNLATAWQSWTTEASIVNWNFANDDWECPKASNDLKLNGLFAYTMQAKDKSDSFEFEGYYTNIVNLRRIDFTLGNREQILANKKVVKKEGIRKVSVIFKKIDDQTTKVIQYFDPETVNSIELQTSGWQAILNNFKQYTESVV